MPLAGVERTAVHAWWDAPADGVMLPDSIRTRARTGAVANDVVIAAHTGLPPASDAQFERRVRDLCEDCDIVLKSEQAVVVDHRRKIALGATGAANVAAQAALLVRASVAAGETADESTAPVFVRLSKRPHHAAAAQVACVFRWS